jgi:hypothetical protein
MYEGSNGIITLIGHTLLASGSPNWLRADLSSLGPVRSVRTSVAGGSSGAYVVKDEIVVPTAGQVEVFDALGNRVSSRQQREAERVTIPTRELPSGVYEVVVHDDEGMRVQRVVITH